MGKRYVISILVGPCSQEEAEGAMKAAHEVVDGLGLGPGTALDHWDEDEGCPGDMVEGVEIL